MRPGQNPLPDQPPLYPLSVSLAGRPAEITCCINYMEFYTLPAPALHASRNWAAFKPGTIALEATVQFGESSWCTRQTGAR